MKIVNRYILNYFRRYFLLALMAFIGLYLIVDFLEKIDNFTRHNAPAKLYLLYYLNSVPMVAVQIVPLAVLLAVFLAIGALSRSNELTAIRSGGISLGHVAMPLLGIAFAISVGVMAASEFLVPVTTENARIIYNVEVKGKQILASQRGNLWFHNSGQLLNVRTFHADTMSLRGIIVLESDSNQQIIHRIDAKKASYEDDQWIMSGVVERHFNPDTGQPISLKRHATLALRLDKTPEDFLENQPRPEEMNMVQLKEMADRLASGGFDDTRYRVDLFAKLGNPFSSLVMAFFGIPFAIQRGRNSNLAMGIGLSIAIGFTFFIAQTVLQAFGYSAVLPPMVAAWGANLIFLMLGIWSLLSTRS
jgi:lipopolysaccharide export system permease protein